MTTNGHVLTPADITQLRCPDCLGRLVAAAERSSDGPGPLVCSDCGTRWPKQRGFARLFREARVLGNDRLLRGGYDIGAPLHDAAVRYLLPLLGGGHEDVGREVYIDRMRLEELQQPEEGPARILEVGVGAGANLPRLLRRIPAGREVELWGMDLSTGMLGQCRRQIARRKITSPDGSHVRLLLADAHALPFADHSFDRVFHIGGIGGFRHPAGALAEMARVAKPGSPIVVVDEGLEPGRRYSLRQRLAFRLITFYEARPGSPAELIPSHCEVVEDGQTSPFFYCLTYRSRLTC